MQRISVANEISFEPGRKRRNLIQQAFLFLLVFALLHGLWNISRGTGAERLAVESLTVGSATILINLLTPTVNATAVNTRIQAAGGGINISNGCEGTEALFLLLAAIIACPYAWRVRCMGLLMGASLIFALNQIRIVTLFYAYRHDRALFDLLHHNVAPLALIAAASLFFLVWTTRHAPQHVVAGA